MILIKLSAMHVKIDFFDVVYSVMIVICDEVLKIDVINQKLE